MRREVREADGRIYTALFIEDRTAELVKVKAAAALPAHIVRNAALLPIYDFLESGDAVSNRVFSHLNPDVAAARFVCDRCGCARPKKAIQNNITFSRGQSNDSM